MDEFKPEDELKPDPSDRHPGRVRRAGEFDNEPQMNFDDVDLDADERRFSRNDRSREEHDGNDSDDDQQDDAAGYRPSRGRRASAKPRIPVSRQYVMMGIGILVLALIILSIGSALKSPTTPADTTAQQQPASGTNGKSVDLSGSTSAPAPANGQQPPASNATNSAPQEVNLPPISSTPNQPQTQPVVQGQQRVEVQGDLNNALTPPQGQAENLSTVSTLPTEPATVAPVAGRNAERHTATSNETASRPERTRMTIEPQHKAQPSQPKTQTVAKAPISESKPATPAKRSEPAKTSTVAQTQPAKEAKPAAAPISTVAPATASTNAATGVGGEISAIKNAPGSHYTLQLSSSSNAANLNAWAKKENLQHYAVYQTARNGQPWYVLVSGVYGSKDDAKRAVATLPADVQAKNPWAKPVHQVQADLK